ncbi:uncharacterized protein LOC118188936 isoform X2 [Stegodyphus dumicola]|nr:uncharacterized protein LOC118188936 isoform X2 [Stegodyphus dumicola]XP_035215354.1 uncharacterized protein LOC118188936 isoform X2 [Stegodyphus dumicola]
MKTTIPRKPVWDPWECTPKQLVNACNTLLLLLITVMCGLVIYEVYDLDKRFISFTDTSIVAIDVSNADFMSSDSDPYWRNVTKDIAVYSAFYDSSFQYDSYLYIIGSSTLNDVYTEDLRCLIKYQDDEIRLVNVSCTDVVGHTSKFFYCFTENEALPQRVALMSLINTLPTQWMNVERISQGRNVDNINKNIAACVKPFVENLTSVQIVSAFIKYYEIIGLKHIYFYNYNASQEVVDFIGSLINDRYSINLLQWNKDESKNANWHTVWSELIQDCSHRSLGEFSHILVVDIWDFIVPMKFDTLPEMIESIETNYNSFTMLQMKHINVCNGSRYLSTSDKENPEHKTYLWENLPPDVNYIWKLQTLSSVTPFNVTGSEIHDQANESLPESDVLIYRFERVCETSFFNYIPQKFVSRLHETSASQKGKKN